MKPKVFIGSSGKSRNFAEAIHARLEDIAEPTVWTAGAFALSTSTLEGLLSNLRDSDFGVFVFGADDDAIVKEELLKVPRDNVVYEAGLFSGYLSPERCFIAVPKSVEVHVPTDLAGMTRGFYDDTRTDGNDDAAVLTFSNQVKKQVRQEGIFKGGSNEELREMVVRFECCSWVGDEPKRVKLKRDVCADIERFCRTHTVNKHRLLAQQKTGYTIALLNAIHFHPDAQDWELIMKIKRDNLPPGFAYYKLMDVVEALKATGNVTTRQLDDLQKWLKALPDQKPEIADRVTALL